MYIGNRHQPLDSIMALWLDYLGSLWRRTLIVTVLNITRLNCCGLYYISLHQVYSWIRLSMCNVLWLSLSSCMYLACNMQLSHTQDFSAELLIFASDCNASVMMITTSANVCWIADVLFCYKEIETSQCLYLDHSSKHGFYHIQLFFSNCCSNFLLL